MIRIGLLIAQQGAAGIWAPSAEACASLAIDELNAARGLLGQPVELSVIDAGSTARSAAAAASSAIGADGVMAIVGMLPSYARGAVSRTIARRVPFVYTPQFEGSESDSGVVTVGETSRELLTPGIEWLSQRARGQRYFLAGSDYVWPRSTFATAREIIAKAGGRIVGEDYLAVGDHDYDRLLDGMRASRADVVLPYFLGADSVAFNRAFTQAGLAEKMLRFSSAIDETILYAIGEDCTENLYATSAYYSCLNSRNNQDFLQRYHGRFGDNPPPSNAYGQSCYEGVHCLAALAEAAGGLRAPALREKVGRALQPRTARGDDQIPIAGDRHPIHFARVDGHEFHVMDWH